MDANSTPEPLGDVLPAPPARADEEHPLGSSDEKMTRTRKVARASTARTTNSQPWTSTMTSTKGRSPCPSKCLRGTSWGAHHLRHSPRNT